jgi:hypothetical protein
MKRFVLAFCLFGLATTAFAFDHSHTAWTALLARHVVVSADGHSSRVRYAGMQAEHVRLSAYLKSLSTVSDAEFRNWSRPQRLAFLINAYNAFTIELVLTRYPDLDSIKDIGGIFQSPWKRKFFSLLGKERSLDEVEHGVIRAPGAFDEPRVHVALVCASIGCPMLRPEAYTAERLDEALEDGMRRFLSDHSRNRFDAADGRLRVSKIFDWYGEDFAQGHQGFTSLRATFARYANVLGRTPTEAERIRAGDYVLDHLDYDWRLNDAGRSGS